MGNVLLLGRNTGPLGNNPPPSTIKWLPGHYLECYLQLQKDSGSSDWSAINAIQPYINAVDYEGVQGLSLVAYWGYLEASSGTTSEGYNFDGNTSITGSVPDIDQMRAALAALSPQRSWAFCLNLGSPGWNNDRYVPTYICQNSAYGAPQVGSNPNGVSTTNAYGLYLTDQGPPYDSGALNLTNANVMARAKALVAAFAAAYDTDPLFAHFRFISTDVITAYGGVYEFSSVLAPYLEFAQYAQSVFTHTPVGVAFGFGQLQSTVVTAVQGGIMCGSSDTSGAIAWTGAYMPITEVFNGSAWTSAPTGAGGTFNGTFKGWSGNPSSGTVSFPMAFSDGTSVTATATAGSASVTWTPSLGALTKSTTGTTVSYNPGGANNGLQTYLNLGGPTNSPFTPLSTPLYELYPGAWDVEPEDLAGGTGAPYPILPTPTDVCNNLNNHIYGAFAFWWGMGPGLGPDNGVSTADWVTSVVPAIQANPLTHVGNPYE